MKSKRTSIGGDTKMKKQRTSTGTKKFRKFILRTEEANELNDNERPQQSRRRTFQIDRRRTAAFFNETLVANNRELASALEDAQMGAENARQKALDVKIQHQVERQALMEKINSLQRDLQQVTQRCGNEVEKAYQNRLSEVHKLLQESIKLLLEGSNRLSLALSLVAPSDDSITTASIQMQTPMFALNTPVPPSSACDNTPPPDYPAELEADTSVKMQTPVTVINSPVTQSSPCNDTRSPGILAKRLIVTQELSRLSEEKMETQLTVVPEPENLQEKKTKSRRRRTRVLKRGSLSEGQKTRTTVKINEENVEPMDTLEPPARVSSTEVSAENTATSEGPASKVVLRAEIGVPCTEATSDWPSSKGALHLDIGVACTEATNNRPAGKGVLRAEIGASCTEATSEGPAGKGVLRSETGKPSTEAASERSALESQAKQKRSTRAPSTDNLRQESKVETTPIKSQRRKSMRPNPYNQAQPRRRSQRLVDIHIPAPVAMVTDKNAQLGGAITGSPVATTEALSKLSPVWIDDVAKCDRTRGGVAGDHKEEVGNNKERIYPKHRRSSHGVCYTEPTLRSKLRQGDRFTDSTLYSSLPGTKKPRKATPMVKRMSGRSALMDLTNVSIKEENESMTNTDSLVCTVPSHDVH